MVRRVGSLVLVLAGVGSLGLVASGCHSDGDGDRRPTSDGSGSTNTEATGAVLFASGFEGSTQVTTTGQVQVDDIAGVDSAGGPSDWGRDLDDRPEIGAFVIVYDGGNTGDRAARVMDDPSSVVAVDSSVSTAGNRVLRYRLASANVLGPTGLPLEGRIQGTLADLVGVRDLYARTRLRLVSDVGDVPSSAGGATLNGGLPSFSGAVGGPRDLPGVVDDGAEDGVVLYEAWNGPQGAAGPQPFRVVVDLVKVAGVGAPLRLRARGQSLDATTLRYTTHWTRESAAGDALPGRWVTLESYIADGREDSGRFWLTVTPEGGAPETVFSVADRTVHPDDAALDGFADIELLDLEAPGDLLAALEASGRALIVDWDDLVLYEGRRPPGVPAPVDPSQLGSGSSNQANPTTPELPPNQVPAPNGAPPAPPGAPPLPNTTPPTPPGPPPPTGGQVPVPPGPPPLPPDQVPSPNTTPTG